MSKDKKGAGSKMDDATMWKHMWIEKGLENIVMEDKCRRLELRSMRIEDLIESLTRESDGRIGALVEIVDYLNRLKEQLAKEQRDHAEAISDVERNAVQERERLKKEIQIRVEETKLQMTRLMEEQLHQKTKRTITENEQLKKEVTYHTRQTDMLMQKNEKLTLEDADLHRSLLLAKEIEEDLSRRNHIYQKTTRVLVYKLRENQDAIRKEKEKEQQAQELSEKETKEKEELDSILSITAPAGPMQDKSSEAAKVGTKEEGQALEPAKPGEEAMKFLHACLEDLELERLMAIKTDVFSPSSGSLVDATLPQGPKRLDQLTLHERQITIKKLLRTADQLRILTDEMVGGGDTLDYSKFGQALPPVTTVANSNIRVDDILAMPTDNMNLDHPVRIYQWKKPTTAAVQADMSAHARRSRNPMLF